MEERGRIEREGGRWTEKRKNRERGRERLLFIVCRSPFSFTLP